MKFLLFIVCFALLSMLAQSQQPSYTPKHFVKVKDTSVFKSVHPANRFVRAFVVTEVSIWDLDDDNKTFVRGGETALVCFEGQIKNNKNEGVYSAYLFDSANHSKRYKIYEQTYKNGKLNGQWRTFSLRGTLVNFQTYKDDSLNGLTKNFWIDGKTIMNEQEYFNGRSKHTDREFFNNGKVKSEIPVENDQLNGTGKKYYEDGTLQEVANFKNGVFHGSQKYYYPNGQLWSDLIYKDGKCWEAIANFTEKGVRRDAGTLRNGNGTVIYYNEDGSVREIQKYQNGEEIK